MRKKIGTGTYFLNSFFYHVLRINKSSAFAVHYTSRVSFGHYLKIEERGLDITAEKCLRSSPGVYIQARSKVRIHSSVHIAPRVKIISSNHDLSNLKKHVGNEPIVIGKSVWIGANAILLPGVTVGERTVIGAGSVVVKSLPAGVVACGNPARIIRQL